MLFLVSLAAQFLRIAHRLDTVRWRRVGREGGWLSFGKSAVDAPASHVSAQNRDALPVFRDLLRCLLFQHPS
jgi:hypothetical protein